LVLQSYIWSIAALLLFFVLDYWLVAGQVHTTAGK
jgi:hypothetical protein